MIRHIAVEIDATNEQQDKLRAVVKAAVHEVDPTAVFTGYSRLAASGDDARRNFWSVDGDADSLAVFIRKFTNPRS